jgi:hypothetical protein
LPYEKRFGGPISAFKAPTSAPAVPQQGRQDTLLMQRLRMNGADLYLERDGGKIVQSVEAP